VEFEGGISAYDVEGHLPGQRYILAVPPE
jgi:hypothetical protein